MPLLLMRDHKNTLLSETYKAVVRRQIEYGEENNVAWGVSESAYNARDLQLNYQYGPFGVPGLGLKRGLAEDLVISPYATALALPIAPKAAIANLRRLENEGMLGRYGFFEAVDYTKDRLPPNQTFARVESYMSHHQGMIFVALDNLLNDDVMESRFHRDPMIESAELLLQERVPRLKAEAGNHAPAVTSGRRASAWSRPFRAVILRPNKSAVRLSALERQLHGDADDCRKRFFALRKSRRDALARGHGPRQLGKIHLLARRAKRRALVERFSADETRTAGLRSRFHRKQSRFPAARCRNFHAHGNHRLDRRRRGTAPCVRRLTNPADRVKSKSQATLKSF